MNEYWKLEYSVHDQFQIFYPTRQQLAVLNSAMSTEKMKMLGTGQNKN